MANIFALHILSYFIQEIIYGSIHGDPSTFGKFLFSSKSTTEVFFQRIFSAHQTGGQ